MRLSDDLLPQWYRLVMARPPPEGDPMEAKLALAQVHRHPIARRRGRPGCGGSLHARRAGGPGTRRRPRIAASSRRSSASAGTNGLAFRPLDQRGAPLDFSGGGPHERTDRIRARRPSSGPRRSPSAGRKTPICPLDRPLDAATILGLPTRAVLKSPCKRADWRAPRATDTSDTFGSFLGLRCESEAFLRRQDTATVFENSTACTNAET